MEDKGKIFELIPEAMRRVGAIGKDSVNKTQGFKYRGIDAVYNALNPVMSDLGLFITPEILDHRREERRTHKVDNNGNNYESVLMFSILTIKYTMYAPDGSNVSCVVVGEGMDSGDKASNKAMSIGLKYACFQLFMIPTEDLVDPDAECHEVTSGARTPAAPKQAKQETVTGRTKQAEKTPVAANVTKVSTVPPTDPKTPENGGNVVTVLDYFAKERENLRVARRITKAENNELWQKQIEVLTANNLIPNKKLSTFSMQEASELVNYMYSMFDPYGTELKKVEG